jgi:prefoldin subunit 5
MKKEQVKLAVGSLQKIEEAKQTVNDAVASAIGIIDSEIETMGGLQADIQSEFDDLSEKAQEGDKGEKLNNDIEALQEILDELESVKDNLEEDPLDDVITKIKNLTGDLD